MPTPTNGVTRDEQIASHLRHLRSRSPQEQTDAIEALVFLNARQAVPMIKDLLQRRDVDIEVAVTASHALVTFEAGGLIPHITGALGMWEPEKIKERVEQLKMLMRDPENKPTLIAGLQSSDVNIVAGTLKALGMFGVKEAIPQITEKLSYPNSRIPARAIEALGALDAKEAIPAIIPFLDNEDYDVKQNAIVALGHLGAGEAIPNITKKLLYKEPQIEAKKALTTLLRDPENKPKLLAGLQSEDAKIVCGTLKALGIFGIKDANSQIIEKLHDSDPKVVGDAIETLGILDEKKAIPGVIDALANPAWEVHWAAEKAIKTLIGENYNIPEVRKSLLAKLGDKNPDTVAWAIYALKAAGVREAIPQIIKRVNNRHYRVAFKAIRALQDFGVKEAIPQIAEALTYVWNDPPFDAGDLRKAAHEALCALVGENYNIPEVRNALVGKLRDKNPAVALQAAKALAVLRANEPIDIIAQDLGDADPHMRWAALMTLKYISSKALVHKRSPKLDHLLHASFGEWPPKGLDVLPVNDNPIFIRALTQDEIKRCKEEYGWQQAGEATIVGDREIHLHPEDFSPVEDHSHLPSLLTHEGTHIAQGDHDNRFAETYGSIHVRPADAFTPQAIASEIFDTYEIPARVEKFPDTVEESKTDLESTNRKTLRYYQEGMEIQARLQEIVAQGYLKWGRMPQNREELCVALIGAGLKPPPEVRKALEQSPTIEQSRKIFGYNFSKLGAVTRIEIGLSTLSNEGLKLFWEQAFPKLYADLIEMYGDIPGRERFGLGKNPWSDIKRVPASLHRAEAHALKKTAPPLHREEGEDRNAHSDRYNSALHISTAGLADDEQVAAELCNKLIMARRALLDAQQFQQRAQTAYELPDSPYEKIRAKHWRQKADHWLSEAIDQAAQAMGMHEHHLAKRLKNGIASRLETLKEQSPQAHDEITLLEERLAKAIAIEARLAEHAVAGTKKGRMPFVHTWRKKIIPPEEQYRDR